MTSRGTLAHSSHDEPPWSSLAHFLPPPPPTFPLSLTHSTRSLCQHSNSLPHSRYSGFRQQRSICHGTRDPLPSHPIPAAPRSLVHTRTALHNRTLHKQRRIGYLEISEVMPISAQGNQVNKIHPSRQDFTNKSQIDYRGRKSHGSSPFLPYSSVSSGYLSN
jgi:hypothetical protein